MDVLSCNSTHAQFQHAKLTGSEVNWRDVLPRYSRAPCCFWAMAPMPPGETVWDKKCTFVLFCFALSVFCFVLFVCLLIGCFVLFCFVRLVGLVWFWSSPSSAFDVMVALTRSPLLWVPHTWMSGTNPLQIPRAWFWGSHKWAMSAALLV